MHIMRNTVLITCYMIASHSVIGQVHFDVSGIYTGKPIFVQNPLAGSGIGFFLDSILVDESIVQA